MTTWSLPPDLRSASRARGHLRSVLAGTPATALIDEAELLVSEVVTNAVLHGRTALTLDVVIDGDRVRVAVSDGDSSLPVVRERDLTRPGGRGMVLVEALAQRWGVGQAGGVGKTVWFELSA